MTNWSAFNTTKHVVESTAWGLMSSTNVLHPETKLISIHQVPKQVPIFSTILPQHVELNEYLKHVILEHRQNNPTTLQSNVKAWHSSWVTHEDNPKFQPIVDITLNVCKFVSEGYFECRNIEYHVLNLWAMMYEETEWTKRHSHFPSDFAAVYYVDVEPGSAPVIFESVVNDGINDNNQPLIVQPENGMLLVWPALLHHEVPPTKGRRMAISMNIEKGERKFPSLKEEGWQYV
tara:strand:- start:106 stop:804 length:699 start_codon:yes stop_codon:yes gene_type:complete